MLVAVGFVLSMSGCQSMLQDVEHLIPDFRSPTAQYQEGMRYTSGMDTEQRYDKGVLWFRKAARRGHVEAQYMLGVAYYTGRGTEQNYIEAVKWLKQAALNGHASAAYLLGNAYMAGIGVEKDQAWAVRWYGKAASSGHARAQFSVGVAYAVGLGVPVNLAQGWKWLYVAEQGGDEEARAVRQKITTRMTAGDLTRAKQLADLWEPSSTNHYADEPTIRYVQYALRKLGYNPGPVDGVLGPRTLRAVENYSAGVLNDSHSTPRISPQLVERVRQTLLLTDAS